MPNMKLILIYISIFLLTACNNNSRKLDTWRMEIMTTENEFAKMANERGVAEAFTTFAADDAVITRNNRIIEGKRAIANYYNDQIDQEVKLEWTPHFIDVAASGDLGYTYGNYTFTATDSSGQIIKQEGVFHTVWKKQSDGTWRYVWD